MSIPTDYPYHFDPTYGSTLEDLRAVKPPAAPSGFEVFWQTRYAHALTVNPAARLRDSGLQHPRWHVQDISFTSTDAFPIAGWLLTPRDGEVQRGLVVGHGYGGRDGPDFDVPVTGTAVLFPCFRGLSRSARAPISTDPAWHVLHDIDQAQKYILGGCVEDVWVAVSVLAGVYPGLAGIGYAGTSFGGGIGGLAVAFDPRIDRGHLVVPTFANIPLWLTLPTVGSGAAVQAYQKAHPEVIETLRFFDSAVAAARIETPMLVAAARFDPAVAPPCQFSLANALTRSKHHETFVLDAGHFDYPEMDAQHARLAAAVRRFFEVT